MQELVTLRNQQLAAPQELTDAKEEEVPPTPETMQLPLPDELHKLQLLRWSLVAWAAHTKAQGPNHSLGHPI
eukprot:COSAG05_NODE_4108_length_1671_cov_2.498728_3_plen_72_part_00